MNALCKCIFIITETIVSIEHVVRHFSKVIDVFKRTGSCLLDT